VQRLQPLCGVTGDAHLFTVATFIGDVKSANSRLGLLANVMCTAQVRQRNASDVTHMQVVR
jgi:hypothetical protein